jgi:hypothetical protein
MRKRPCEAVLHWLHQQQAGRSGALLDPALVDHTTDCPACRGLLLTASIALLQVPAPPPAIMCSDCEHNLDAFIDWEERYGPAAAAQRYPRIWWHLLNCADCADVHAGVHALLRAEAAGELMALPLPQIYPVFQLPRTYLHAALAPQLALGVGWGADDAQQIAAAHLGAFQLTLAAYPSHTETVTLHLQIDPPVSGAVEVRLDPLFVRAPLAAGSALIPDVPAALFASVADADLCVDLELDEPLT